MTALNFHEKIAEIQADPKGIEAIQYLQSQGLGGYLLPVPFRNSDIEDSPANILERDLSIGATLVEQISEHLHLMGAQTMQHVVNIGDVQYQFIAQLVPAQGEALQEAQGADLEICPSEQAVS